MEKRKGLLKVTPRKKRWQCASQRLWLGPVWVDCESPAESPLLLSSTEKLRGQKALLEDPWEAGGKGWHRGLISLLARPQAVAQKE